MPKPRNIPIDTVRGASKTVQFVFDDKPNLTGAQIVMTVKRHATDFDAVLVKQPDITLSTNLANGECWFSIIPAETCDLDPRTYVYELRITMLDGTVYVPLVGDFYIFSSVKS